MTDHVFNAFLEESEAGARELAGRSDLLDLECLDPSPCRTYIAHFRCKGLVSGERGIVESERFQVGVTFPPDYLRRAAVSEVVTLLGPINTYHPNVMFPFICVGRLVPGTTLVDLLFQCHEILSYQKVTMREDDALNRGACAWARDHRHRLPIDSRPLARGRLAIAIEKNLSDSGAKGGERE